MVVAGFRAVLNLIDLFSEDELAYYDLVVLIVVVSKDVVDGRLTVTVVVSVVVGIVTIVELSKDTFNGKSVVVMVLFGVLDEVLSFVILN